MRVLRAGLAAVAAAVVLGLGPAASAQTTTTSSIPSLPVTGSGTADAGDERPAAGEDLATTGIDADALLQAGVAFVVLGAALRGGERLSRRGQPRLTIG